MPVQKTAEHDSTLCAVVYHVCVLASGGYYANGRSLSWSRQHKMRKQHSKQSPVLADVPAEVAVALVVDENSVYNKHAVLGGVSHVPYIARMLAIILMGKYEHPTDNVPLKKIQILADVPAVPAVPADVAIVSNSATNKHAIC